MASRILKTALVLGFSALAALAPAVQGSALPGVAATNGTEAAGQPAEPGHVTLEAAPAAAEGKDAATEVGEVAEQEEEAPMPPPLAGQNTSGVAHSLRGQRAGDHEEGQDDDDDRDDRRHRHHRGGDDDDRRQPGGGGRGGDCQGRCFSPACWMSPECR